MSPGMKIVRPYAVQDGDLTTNAVNADADWLVGTAYTIGQRVSYGRRIYESVQNGTGHQPDTSPEYWFDVGPTNQWAMFDDRTTTQTTRASPLDVSVQASGYVDTIGLLNVSASLINITIFDGVTEVYNQNFPMTDETGVTDYYEYFFEPIIMKTDLTVTGLPDITAPTINVSVQSDSTVAVGAMVMGQSRYIGMVYYGATIGIIDFSIIEDDGFGNTFIVERDFSRRGRFTVSIDSVNVDATYNLVSSYRATPVMVIATEKYASTFYYGLLREAEIEIAYPTHSILSLEVRGL